MVNKRKKLCKFIFLRIMSKVSDEKTEEKASEEKKAEYKGTKNLLSVVSNRSKRLKRAMFSLWHNGF